MKLRHARCLLFLPSILPLCLVLAIAGCAPGDTGSESAAPPSDSTDASAAVVTPPAGSDLLPIAVPDYSAMAAPVARQMQDQHETLQARLADAASTPTARGEAYGRFGMLFLAATHFDAAEASLRNAQTLMPEDGRWPYYLGRTYQAQGQLDASVRAFERAVEARPGDAATLVLLGDALLEQGDLTAAEETFRQALDASPDAAPAEFGLGQVALAREDHARAAEHLETALSLNPRATSIHYPLALAYRGLGDTERAEAHLRQRGDVDPLIADPLRQELDTLLESANAYNLRGGQALDAGDYRRAADLFRRGLELDPADPSLRQRLGIALFQLGDPTGAMEQFEDVVRVSPAHTQSQFSLGVLLVDQGRPGEAIERFETALEYDPEYIQARLQLAEVLSRTGRPEESLPHYDRVLEQDPTLTAAVFGAAMALVRLERYEAALERLDAGLDASPDDRMFKHALARLLAAAPDDDIRDGERAMSLVEELLEDEQSFVLGETAAMALAELGAYDQAVAVQRDVMNAADQAGLAEVLPRMRSNLSLYEQGQPSRIPFTDDELP